MVSPHATTEAEAATPMVRLAGVTKRFRPRGGSAEVAALNDVSLEVQRGSIFGIIGRSGAGKSTLVRLLNGLEQADAGSVTIDGLEMRGLRGPALRQARQRIGMVFQHFNLLSSRTVAANVALPLELQGVPKAERAARVAPLLELVGLTGKADRYPAELSGGQKQRVGIARALAAQPHLLLCDEATSALDPETTDQILALVKDINRQLSITVVLITHEMAVIRRIATHLAVLDAGRVVETGASFDLIARPAHPVTRALLEGDRDELPGWLRELLAGGQDAKRLLRVTFTGDASTEPVLSRLARELDIDVNILQGQIDTVADRPFGTIVVGVPAGAEAQVRDFLARHRLQVEALFDER